jgi:catechol 2,3-dioxygenase-like lactoylglutathione lyase family enzyme
MFDHVGLNVSDYGHSRSFYEGALAQLGYSVMMAHKEWKLAGFGTGAKPEFWICQREPLTNGAHIAFQSPDRATVDAFHAAALASGGQDNGAPGPRPEYHAGYYSAFVLDPDGNNVEAVCHLPADAA